VDDDILSSLLSAHPIVPLIQSGRSLTKLRGTYTQKLPAMAWADGRVRTTFRLNVARTGRMASEEPNMQNVSPIIRSGFIASPGCVLGAVDLSQIELVWAAELSGDPSMCEAFTLGQDLHVKTACSLFRLDYDGVSTLWKQYKAKELTGHVLEEVRSFEVNQRLPGKTLSFSVLYGTTPPGLQAQILSAGGPLWTVDECEGHIQGWFDAYPGIRDWMSLQYSRAQRYGLVWNAFGRWRLIGEAMSAVPRVRSAGLRQAGNQPIQGSAGDMLKIGMAATMPLVDYYRRLYHNCIVRPILAIHDELVYELSKDIAADFLEESRQIIIDCVHPMSIPVKASMAMAEDWFGLK
jgi:DNA polymerase-1